MPCCVAFGCRNRPSKNCGISFHSFPPKGPQRKKWVRYCEREDFKEARKASKLCSKHFNKEQFAVDLEFLAQYGYENAHARLKPDAVPDIPIQMASVCIFF